MTLKFHNITNMKLFSVISSWNAMFEASSVYFQCINEWAAHVKIDPVFCWCGPGPKQISNFSCYRMAFHHWGFMNENQKALGVQGWYLVFLQNFRPKIWRDTFKDFTVHFIKVHYDRPYMSITLLNNLSFYFYWYKMKAFAHKLCLYWLTVPPTIQTFNNPETEDFWKHWWPAFFPFPMMF